MIPGRGFSLKALIAGSLFLNGLAIGVCALYLLAPADSHDTVLPQQTDVLTSSEIVFDVKQSGGAQSTSSSDSASVSDSDSVSNSASVSDSASVELESGIDSKIGITAVNDDSVIESHLGEARSETNSSLPAQIVSTGGGHHARDNLSRLMENADSIGAGGDFNRALKIYESIYSLDSDYRKLEIAARMAMCRESLGNSKQAFDSYQAIAEQSDDPRLVAACRIGVARTTLRNGKPEVASRLLWKMLLNGELFQNQDAYSAELIFLLAESELIQLEKLTSAPPASPQRIASAPINGASVDFFRLLIGIDRHSDDSASNSFQIDETIRVVSYQTPISNEAESSAHNPTFDSGLVLESTSTVQVDVNPHLKTASIFATGATKLELINRIAAGAGLTMQIDEAVRNRLVSEFQDVSRSQIRIDMALDALLLSSGMLWTTHEQTLTIVPVGNNLESLKSSRLAGLERILRHGILYFPGHRQVLLATTALANVTFWQGNPAVAIGHYENLLREANLKRVYPLIRFNLGVCFLQLNDLSKAEHHFQQVVDNSLSGTVLGEAYLHSGILQIESGRYSDAVRSFSRAVATARESETKQVACLGLAAAYLENANPYAALTTIESNKNLFNDGLIDPATFLVCLARYRVSSNEVSESARYLLSATSRVQPQDLPGMIGFKLVADAFDALNFQEEKLATLELASRQPGISSLRYSFELARARAYSEAGQLEAAATIFDLLGNIPSSLDPQNNEDALQALIELVELRYRTENYDQALSTCRHAIQLDSEMRHKTELLGLLGKIFQKQGNNIAAAMCFAGLMPTWEEE